MLFRLMRLLICMLCMLSKLSIGNSYQVFFTKQESQKVQKLLKTNKIPTLDLVRIINQVAFSFQQSHLITVISNLEFLMICYLPNCAMVTVDLLNSLAVGNQINGPFFKNRYVNKTLRILLKSYLFINPTLSVC